MSASDGGDLDNDTEDEDGRGSEDAVLAREDLCDETGHDGAEPSAELENRREPTSLRLDRNVSLHVCAKTQGQRLHIFAYRSHMTSLLTPFKGWHDQDTGEHALVVAVQDTANAGKSGDAGDLPILEQGAGARGAHEGLALGEGGIVGRSTSAGNHLE